MKAKRINQLTEEQIEQMATEIREFLLEHDMWIDTTIYFNRKCYTTFDKESGKHYYNDREHLIERDNEDPKEYFEYVNPEHILSMSFEGPVYEMINGYDYPDSWLKEFNDIFEKRGLYYEQGHAWNFSCYYM